jgi:hypothetical protein
MKFIQHIILLITCLVSLQTQAQQPTITGVVLDEIKGSGIPDVHIIVQRKNTAAVGITSDRSGKFSIESDFPVTLKFSHVAYLSQTIQLAEKPTENIVIALQPKSQVINTFTVNGDRIDTICPDHNRNIWDYTFVDDHILVIDFYNRVAKGRLSLLTFFGDTIATLPLPGRTGGFMRDCIGQLYLLLPNEMRIVNWERGELFYSDPLNREMAEQALHGCVDSYWPYIYFEDGFGASSSQQYYAVNQMTQESSLVVVIRDSVMAHQMKDDLLVTDPTSSSASGKSLYQFYLSAYGSASRAARHMGYDKAFREQIVYVQGYNPLLMLGTQLYVFNHTQSVLSTYDPSGKILSEAPISYHNKAGWEKKVLTDNVLGKAYALSESRQGIIELCEINLKTGKTGDPTRIDYPHVENIQIHDGFVYFLYRGVGDTKKRLYRIAAST